MPFECAKQRALAMQLTPWFEGCRPAAAAVVLRCLPSGLAAGSSPGLSPSVFWGNTSESREGAPRGGAGFPEGPNMGPKSGTVLWPRRTMIMSQVRGPSRRRETVQPCPGRSREGFPGARSGEHLALGRPQPTRVRAGPARGSQAHGPSSSNWAKTSGYDPPPCEIPRNEDP